MRLTRQMTMRTGHPVVKETIRGLGRVLPDSHQVKGGLGLSHKLGVSPVVALSSEQASKSQLICFLPILSRLRLRIPSSVPLLVPHCHFLLAPLSLWRSAASAASPHRRMINDSPHIITKCKQTALITTSEESAMQNILHPMSYSLPKAGVNFLAAYLQQDVPYFR